MPAKPLMPIHAPRTAFPAGVDVWTTDVDGSDDSAAAISTDEEVTRTKANALAIADRMAKLKYFRDDASCFTPMSISSASSMNVVRRVEGRQCPVGIRLAVTGKLDLVLPKLDNACGPNALTCIGEKTAVATKAQERKARQVFFMVSS